MNQVVVAVVQLESALGDTRANARMLREWLARSAAAGARMVVFPECSLTGFTCRNPCDAAVGASDESVCSIIDCAAELGVSVGFGFIERASGQRPFNTFMVTDGDARLVYRKTHLGASEAAFAAGDDLGVSAIAGMKVGVQLCWEAHIPDISTMLRTKGAQVLLCPHSVGTDAARRMDLWSRYMPARALDNGVFVLACNALRCQEGVHAGGGIAVWSPDGSLVASYAGSDEHMELVVIGGLLPSETPDGDMTRISYFNRRRPELY